MIKVGSIIKHKEAGEENDKEYQIVSRWGNEYVFVMLIASGWIFCKNTEEEILNDYDVVSNKPIGYIDPPKRGDVVGMLSNELYVKINYMIEKLNALGGNT